ncbi:MAG: hypothetical protein ABI457_09410 [Hyphomicrobium sp.]
MIKLLAASAAAFITLTAALAPTARACDEDCAYEAHEAAYESAYERSSAREEAAEEGYSSYEGRRSSGSPSRRGQAGPAAQTEKSAVSSSESRRAEPKPVDPEPRTQSRTPRTKVADENSSISSDSETDRIADDDSSQRRPAKAVGCRKYFPAAGMTLSVPCE